MAAKRRVYTDKFKAGAVVMLEAAGYPENHFELQRIADSLKMPSRTLRRWFNLENGAPPDELVKQSKKDLATRLEELTHRLIDLAFAVADGAEDDTSIQQALTSVGISVDKLQLLKGEPTDRHEIVDNGERARRVNQLLDTAGARRTGRPVDDGLVQ